MAMAHVAASLDKLEDSHTFFLPPQRPYTHDYGFQLQMIGNRCYVSRVRPGSDAEAKGVRPGDEVLGLNGYRPIRDNLWKMQYAFWMLRPQAGLRLNLLSPTGTEEQLDAMAKIRELPAVLDATGSGIWDLVREEEREEYGVRVRYAEEGDDLLIVKIPEFLPELEVDSVTGKMRKHSAVILDLRGDPGGSVDTLEALLGSVFKNKVKIADRVARDSTKPLETIPTWHGFSGKLVVLVDSQSASAAELFARVIQLENRGLVVGDRSAGAVMEAERYSHTLGVDKVIAYGASVTVANLIMTDGKSLEHRGVIPDVLALPTPDALQAAATRCWPKPRNCWGSI